MSFNRLLLSVIAVIFFLPKGHADQNKINESKKFVQNLIDKTKNIAKQPPASQGDSLGKLFSSSFDIKRAAQQVGIYRQLTDSQKCEFQDVYCARIKMQYGTSDKLNKFMRYDTKSQDWKILEQSDDTILIKMIFFHKDQEEPDVPISMMINDQKICDISIENISIVQTNTDELNAEFNGNDITQTLTRLKKRLQ